VNSPLFSADDLREMEARSVDRLVAAIEAGERDRAVELARRMFNEFEAMHDLYRDWTAATLSAVGRRFGDAALEDVMHESVKAWWGPISKKLGDVAQPLAKRIRMFVAGLRGHLQPMTIEEDDEKVVICMRPCGSGGRLILEGKYEGPDAFFTVAEAQQMTYGRENFPVYCAHEPAMEAVDIDANGAPFMVVEPAAQLGREHCRFIIYKDRDRVPERYYERVGRKKPGA
jgi:hypothetical protein